MSTQRVPGAILRHAAGKLPERYARDVSLTVATTAVPGVAYSWLYGVSANRRTCWHADVVALTGRPLQLRLRDAQFAWPESLLYGDSVAARTRGWIIAKVLLAARVHNSPVLLWAPKPVVVFWQSAQD